MGATDRCFHYPLSSHYARLVESDSLHVNCRCSLGGTSVSGWRAVVGGPHPTNGGGGEGEVKVIVGLSAEACPLRGPCLL